jgi:hypothetical protein
MCQTAPGGGPVADIMNFSPVNGDSPGCGIKGKFVLQAGNSSAPVSCALQVKKDRILQPQNPYFNCV